MQQQQQQQPTTKLKDMATTGGGHFSLIQTMKYPLLTTITQHRHKVNEFASICCYHWQWAMARYANTQ